MQACVLSFNPRTGVGSQTVTGVVDANGNAFVGKVFLFQSGYNAINTLTGGGVPGTGGFATFRGVDDGTVRSTFGCCDAWSPFNFKAVSSFQSLGDYSLVSGFTANFGDMFIERLAKISAIRSGEFDLNFIQNDRTGDAVFVMVLGGSDLDITFTNKANGTYGTASKPQGLLALPTPEPNAGGGTSGGVGGEDVSWGFATRDGVYGASNLSVANQDNNFAYQRTTGFSNPIVGTIPTVSAWTDTAFTLANGPSAGVPMAICGDAVRTAGGTLTQPLVTGSQTINVGINAKVVIFLSTGQVASTSVISPSGQHVMGWATPTSQVGYWTGEKTNGNVYPVYGARYGSDSATIRFGEPNGLATTFDSVAAVTDIDSSGTVTLDWSAVDGTARQVLWFAIGEDAVVPGSITVTKVVSAPSIFADQAFEFTASGGLSPASFFLKDTESQAFTGVTPGSGYGITETLPSDLWTVTYTISNGSPNDNITVLDGEDVTVLVTNTYVGPPADMESWRLYRFDIKPRAESRA